MTDPSTTGKTNRPRVVIAEDYVLIQENIRKVLEAQCEIVAAVEDGKSALDAVAAYTPDILLLDVSLPDMSGFAVLELLTASNVAVKVILVTAHGDRAYVERAFQMGVKGYVLKGKLWLELPAAVRTVASGGTFRSALLG